MASTALNIGDPVLGAEDQAKAFINILVDFADEKLRLTESQTATLNILEDCHDEKNHHHNVQKAIFNIFDDLHIEKSVLESAQARIVRAAQQVEAALREKEVLLQEIHHLVKNNLQVVSSLIHLQIRKLSDMASRVALEDCQNRVLAIALIHEKLYQTRDYASVPFSDYARSLASSIFHATGVSPGKVELSIQFEDISIAMDKATPCGLVMNELISNALKHAFPGERRGKLRVELRRAGAGKLDLVVADDGVGMDADFDPATSDSLGMQLVTTLVEQLDGQLEIFHEAGTTFRIRFPSEVSA